MKKVVNSQALYMLLASLFFASMGVCIKFASVRHGSFELVFYRGLVGLFCVAVYMRWQRVTVRTLVPGMHLWRCTLGSISLVAGFYSFAQLPMATAMTLYYMNSVWIAAFLVGGALVLRRPGVAQRGQGPIVVSVLTGFCGVALMLQPTLVSTQVWGAVAGLASGVLAAAAYLQVSALARAGEPTSRTVLYFSVAITLAGGGGVVLLGHSTWVWPHALWLLPMGMLGMLGQVCLTRAYASGATLLVANLQYSGIVFAGLFGIFIFRDKLGMLAWFGMALIVASGIAATLLCTQTAHPLLSQTKTR